MDGWCPGQRSLPHVVIPKTERNGTINLNSLISSYNTPWSEHKHVVSIYSNTETSLAMSGLVISAPPPVHMTDYTWVWAGWLSCININTNLSAILSNTCSYTLRLCHTDWNYCNCHVCTQDFGNKDMDTLLRQVYECSETRQRRCRCGGNTALATSVVTEWPLVVLLQLVRCVCLA